MGVRERKLCLKRVGRIVWKKEIKELRRLFQEKGVGGKPKSQLWKEKAKGLILYGAVASAY